MKPNITWQIRITAPWLDYERTYGPWKDRAVPALLIKEHLFPGVMMANRRLLGEDRREDWFRVRLVPVTSPAIYEGEETGGVPGSESLFNLMRPEVDALDRGDFNDDRFMGDLIRRWFEGQP